MEHLCFGCELYSELQWIGLGKYKTQYIQQTTDLTCHEIRIMYRYIIFDKEIKDIRRKLPSKNIRKLLQLLIQEVRRDIYYWKDKVNHVPNNNEEVLPLKEEISYYFCNRENYPILP